MPNLAMGQSAISHYVWQDQRSFEPISRTATMITGKIKLSGLSEFGHPGSKMTITFGNGKSAVLTSVGASWREWNHVNREKVSAEVFRFDRDPGKLENGNMLCGGGNARDDARYIVFFEYYFADHLNLGVDVFGSENVPKDINSPGLCGTFSFETLLEKAPKVASGSAPPVPTHRSTPSPSIAMKKEGGTYVVPVLINNAITLDFTVDSGASDVTIPEDVVSTLMRMETIRDTDFLGERTYTLADGSKVKSKTFRIRSLKVGDHVLENVTGSVASTKGSLLLGQSFLGRFKSWSIDNTKHVLVLE
ncbi:MAG: retropepsin-like aspartic protease [Verrucomicrobiaceae bacterium]